MAINYTVKATVVDITHDTPQAEDIFFVDTNVWYWMTYTRASQRTKTPSPYQTKTYPAYTNNVLLVGAKIYQSGLSLSELAHLIEKAEFEIYATANPAVFSSPYKFDKNYRHSFPSERSRVVSEVQAAWGQVTSMACPLALTIDSAFISSALKSFHTVKIDGYDLFILESMKNKGIDKIITDDGDFATVQGIEVFTANKNVITTAKSQGKLCNR